MDTERQTFLVTGVTGFLGKVVLEELIRQHKPTISRIYVLIRGRKGQSAHQRFAQISQSECFSLLDPNWADQLVSVIPGDLAEDRCGISPADYALLTTETTHIINCAANVKFDANVRESIDANIEATLRLAGLAKACPRLRRLVHTSTAYVAVGDGPLHERLASLPAPAFDLYKQLLNNPGSLDALLSECGYPNVYSLTKSLAEHLLVDEVGGAFPLSIVRASIISASWQYPYPGWIDSRNGLSAFVTAIGSGAMKVIIGNMDTLCDFIPVDQVSQHLLDEAFHSSPSPITMPLKGSPLTTISYIESPRILFSTVCMAHAARLDATVEGIVEHFRNSKQPATRIIRRPKVEFIGMRGHESRYREMVHHVMPMVGASTMYRLKGDGKQAKRAMGLAKLLGIVNDVFEPYTMRTFDFRSSLDLFEGFDTDEYLKIVFAGVERHLMQAGHTWHCG